MKPAALLLVLSSVTSSAHHSLGATYDLKNELKLEGKIVGVLLRNPHSFLQIDAPDQDGTVQRWALEWSSANSLAKQGVQPGTLKAGDQVTITINPPSKLSDKRGNLVELHRASDGLEWRAKRKQKRS
jgi:hypothetical protein